MKVRRCALCDKPFVTDEELDDNPQLCPLCQEVTERDDD
jgi:hypothetical protein